MDPNVILETALSKGEVTAIEALMLLQDEETAQTKLLEVADTLNQRLNGKTVTYVRSKQIHYTNICRADCKFCSFYKKKNQKGTFTLKLNEIIRAIRDAGQIREVVLSGGLNPDQGVSAHVQILRTIRREFPRLHVHGYSPAEIYFLARRARTTPLDVLRKFHDAGLHSLSGDSAEILNDKIRKKICSDKLRTADWVDIIKTAHRLKMPTTATMLFGHIEDEIQVCEHLEIIKNLQSETGGIATFEPIPFIPAGTALGRDRKIRSMPSLVKIHRIFAIARIFFGPLIRNISVDWTKLGLPNAATCLSAGANDLGGLSVDSHEIRAREVNGRLTLSPAQVKLAVSRVGKRASERAPYDGRALKQRRRKEEAVLV